MWGWYGSALVSANQPVAVVVNQLRDAAPALGASYEGIPDSAASQTVILPRVVRGYSNRYYSNFTVHDAGSGTASITIHYYDSSGTLVISPTDTVSASTPKTYNLYTAPPSGLPHGFVGSVVITADREIVASSNLLDYNNYYDTISYTGVNR